MTLQWTDELIQEVARKLIEKGLADPPKEA